MTFRIPEFPEAWIVKMGSMTSSTKGNFVSFQVAMTNVNCHLNAVCG